MLPVILENKNSCGHLHHVLKLCHTSAQNAPKSKHVCKGELLLDVGKKQSLY